VVDGNVCPGADIDSLSFHISDIGLVVKCQDKMDLYLENRGGFHTDGTTLMI